MEKLLIVDGSNLLFQMFYGMPSRIVNGQGQPIQGTLGFTGALLKMLRLVKPTYAAVVFDGECANPRQEIDPSYKANRENYEDIPEEETPFSQLPDIFKVLTYLGIAYRETTDCEADDWMARFAWRYGDDREVIIASQDSDLFQLITPSVRILRYRGEKSIFCDEQYILDKLGVLPGRYADFKALTGDASDNIPGVPKIGPKTAEALINRFDSLQGILDRAEQIEKPSIRASLRQHQERVRQNYRLVKLEGDGQLPFSLAEMKWLDLGYTTSEVLRATGVK